MVDCYVKMYFHPFWIEDLCFAGHRQVILRWHLQRDTTPIPKASTRARLAENRDVFDFELSEAEMKEGSMEIKG